MCILTFVFCPTRSNLKESPVALMPFLILTPSTPVPWVSSGGCRAKRLTAHPRQSTLWIKAVQNRCWWQHWCSGFPPAATSAGSQLCRLWQTWSSNYSVLQMNSLGIEASAESASTEQKCLLFWYGGVSVGGRRALASLPLLYPSSLRCHSLYSSSLCLLLSTEILVLSPSSLTPGWRLCQEIREGSGGLFLRTEQRGECCLS